MFRWLHLSSFCFSTFWNTGLKIFLILPNALPSLLGLLIHFSSWFCFAVYFFQQNAEKSPKSHCLRKFSSLFDLYVTQFSNQLWIHSNVSHDHPWYNFENVFSAELVPSVNIYCLFINRPFSLQGTSTAHLCFLSLTPFLVSQSMK